MYPRPEMAHEHEVSWNFHVSNAVRERLPGLVIEEPEARAGRT